MSYAKRIDGAGWRAVNGPEDCDPETETWQEEQPAPVAPPPPSSVTMRQARLALLSIGKLADVATAIAALPPEQRAVAEIEWEFASTVERESPLIALMAPALELTSEDLDDLFALGSTL